MAAERRPYRRETEDKRRQTLITATLALVSEGGSTAATVRAIAERAGVTPGLIRHYFAKKEQLIADAYRHLMTGMTDDSAAVLNFAPPDPHARLAAFIAASLRPPVVDGEAVVRWASFIQETRRNPAMLDIHHQTYLGYRDNLQQLIAALPKARGEEELRHLAIACNAIIDGLWLEGGTLPDAFARGRTCDHRHRVDRQDAGRRPALLPHAVGAPKTMRYAAITDRLADLGGAKWEVHIRARAMAAAGVDILSLSIGEPDTPPPAELLTKRARRWRRAAMPIPMAGASRGCWQHLLHAIPSGPGG